MAAPAVIQPTTQQYTNDCGIACLVMLLGRPYQEVWDAAARLIKGWPDPKGLTTRSLQRIAKALGTTLVAVYPETYPDWRDETGILLVRRGREYHFIVLFQGVVINPQNSQVWDLDSYLHNDNAHPIRFLRA